MAAEDTAKPKERVQRIVFIRHGVAHHNFKGADLSSPTLFDPSLVMQGKVGALEAGQKIQMWFSSKTQKVELVIASPLTRCLQTAVLAFFPGDNYNETERDQRQRTRIVSVEGIREAYGAHYPDKRRRKSLLIEHWPMVEFDNRMTENDELWTESSRETLPSIERRAESFLSKLCQLPETNIVVVSHGVFLEVLFHKFNPQALEGGRRIYNCEAFSSECVSSAGSFLRLQNTNII